MVGCGLSWLLLVTVGRRKVISRLGHQALLLRSSALLQRLFAVRTAIALPQEHYHLTDQHTHSTGSQSCQNAQRSRDDNKADNARGSALPVTVRAMVHMVVVRVAGTSHVAFGLGREWHTIVVGMRRTRTTALWLGAHNSEHTGLGGSEQRTNPVEQKSLQAHGLSAALSPRNTVLGVVLDIGLDHVKVALGVVEEADCYGVQRDWVAVQVEDSEANSDQIDRFLWRRRQRQHLDGISQRDRLRLLVIR